LLTTTDLLTCPQHLYLGSSTPITMYPMYVCTCIDVQHELLAVYDGESLLHSLLLQHGNQAGVHLDKKQHMLPGSKKKCKKC
jgi:hypothetical protein